MIPEEMSVLEFKRRKDAGDALVVLDVREDDELSAARLPYDVLHVPMAQVPERLAELPKDGDIVVMCHGGVRSGKVARYLRAQGFASVANMTGGIDAYSTLVDASVPTY
jgi:rhodanese-related sulfurtransferase